MYMLPISYSLLAIPYRLLTLNVSFWASPRLLDGPLCLHVAVFCSRLGSLDNFTWRVPLVPSRHSRSGPMGPRRNQYIGLDFIPKNIAPK